jgi:hypothetical protein
VVDNFEREGLEARDCGLLGRETSRDGKGDGVTARVRSDSQEVDWLVIAVSEPALALLLEEPLLNKRSTVPGLIVDLLRLPLRIGASVELGQVRLCGLSASWIVSCRVLRGESENDDVEPLSER